MHARAHIHNELCRPASGLQLSCCSSVLVAKGVVWASLVQDSQLGVQMHLGFWVLGTCTLVGLLFGTGHIQIHNGLLRLPWHV